jgi:hypothetical protein
MTRPLLARIEDAYLKLFRIALLVILTLVLVATLAMAVQGAMKATTKPQAIEPAREAPAPAVGIDAFIEEFDKQPMPDAPPPADATPARPDTALDDKVTAQIRKLYGYFDGYQRACRIPSEAQVDQRTFESSFNRRVMRELFKELGDPYVESQAAFEKALLSHPRIIAICVEKQGRAQVFWTSMNWHLEQWRLKVKESADFADAEAERVERETVEEATRVAAAKAAGVQQLFIALGLFGAFISLALLLIFAKIESNLRGVQVIERAPQDA